ncbi:BaiN/RdsA family NAD(P)/FAD-dependent oxidoreductase [Winogradskyella aurantiaca]|uniref:NAD(P)/FAD-dependent oxidoreductase n=1 Tax=Winogradskyella aurantiaca TaxID=2219558 RepID=UPI001E65034B|nr:NAD(P)/FAD-dependent oxidoreductase [Winogradskyella aurantiaca]
MQSSDKIWDLLIIGGGAAGFFTAINSAELHPELSIAILEKAKQGLQKVKISGGGRCNVTHAEFVPKDLSENYPRGQKELLGPFHSFMTGDTMQWFQDRGVPLKIEEDGRVFPASDSSQSIIDCFLNETQRLGVEIYYNCNVNAVKKTDYFEIETNQGMLLAKGLIIATGSSPKAWKWIQSLGHQIVPAVPSLFTFDIDDPRLKDIPGVVVKDVAINVSGTHLESEGPVLVTHVGLSAPSVLKLSAFGALELARLNYQFQIQINFVRMAFNACLDMLKTMKIDNPKKQVMSISFDTIPKRLWQQLVKAAQIPNERKWADLSKQELQNLTAQLTQARFQVSGKSTFKEEFVTAGGVELSEVNFKTFESKLIPGLYFAGEVLNIDAVTGGFNFQNAWTGGYLISQNLQAK